MASRKNKFSFGSLDFSDQSRWSEDDFKRENALTRAKAYAQDMTAQGAAVSQADIDAMADQFYRTGNIDYALEADRKPTAPVLPQPAATPEQAELDAIRNEGQSQGYFGGLVDALQSSVQRTLGSVLVADEIVARDTGDTNSRTEAIGSYGRELLNKSKANADAARVQYEKAQDSNWLMRNLKQGFLDVGESGASGAASLAGGDFGYLPMFDQFTQQYVEARDAGLSHEDASKWASAQAAPEAISFIPAGKILGGFGKGAVRETVEGLAKVRIAPSVAAGVAAAKTGIGEGAEETVTGAIQDLASAAMAGAGQSGLQEFASKRAPKTVEEFAENRYRDFRAGALMGGTLAAPGATRNAYREDAQARAADTTATTEAGLQGFLQEQGSATARQDNEINRQLFDAEQDVAARDDIVRIAQEREAVFAGREQEQANLEAQKAIDEEAAFRTLETERTTGGTRVERYGTSDLPEEVGRGAQVIERVPVQPAAETTPEQVAAEQEAVRQQEAAKAEQDALAPFNATLLKEMEAERKSKEKAEAKKTTEQKAADRKRQREVARQLLAENPGKDITELAPLLRDRLAQPVQTEAVAPAQEAPVVAAPVAEVVQPTVTETESPVLTGNAKIDEQARKMGITSLNMDAVAPEVLPDVNVEDFKTKVQGIVQSLVNRNTRESADTQNLIRTGKMVVAPNAQSIGRADTGAAAYDTATGKMYMYTDNLNANDDVGAMVAAFHEATHAGQFNDRDGRDNIVRSVMGQERYDAAQSRVRAQARKQIREGKQGPERAALEAAEAAARSNPDFNGDVEALEVMPYYVGEAARRQAESSGVRSVAKEVVGATRKYLRDNLGMDLDVNMQDVDYAARRVAGEIVNTELSPTEGSGNLDMVVGGRFTNDPRQRYKGAIDGLSRYVMSDAEAEVMAEHIPALQRGQMIPLGELLNHPPLYEAYPQLREVRVVLDDDQKGYGAGVFNPNTGEIGLSEESVANLDSEDIRNTVLHETQHAVQNIEGFIAGENWERLMSPTYKADEVRDRQRRERAINRFDLGRWKQTTTPTRLQEFNNEVASKGISGDTFAQSQLVLQNGWNADSTDRIVQRYGDSVYAPARDALNTSIRALNAENKRAMDLYFRNYGEAEARTTEATSRMSQRELDNVSFEELFPEARNGVRVEDTLDTLGYGRGRTPEQSRSTSLEMAATQTPEAKKTRKTPLWFSNLFDSTKGVGRDINAMVEAAQASPAGDYMLAEQTVGKYQTSLKKLAANQGTTYAKLNAKIEKELGSLTNQGSWEANKQAFNYVVGKYGEAGQNLQALRDQIDDLSLDMWTTRVESGNPFTEAEKARYKALLANLGYYTNRQYAAMTGKAGKEYANKVWNDYERYKRTGGDDPVRKQNYETVAKAVQRLVDDSLRIPDDASIADMSADQVRRMYDTWVGPSTGAEMEAMKNSLAERRESIGEDRLTNEAEAITKELLGLTEFTRPVTEFYRGGKLNKGILQERTHMPEEIRTLLGEITDPSMKMLLTVGKQAEFTSRNKLLLDLRNYEGRDLQPPDATGTAAVQGMSVLEGELWGPLEGYYASPNMRSLIGDMMQQTATFEQALALAAVRPSVLNDKVVTEALGLWGRLAGRTKMLQIVASPMNFVYNYMGAYASILANGNINPANVVKGHKAMSELLNYAVDSTNVGDEARRMNSLGITDSAFIGEIKSGQYKSLQKLIKGMAGKGMTMPTVVARLEHAKVLGTEAYAMMDVWGKMANFYQQVDVLTDFYKKNGDKKSAEDIDREAADITNRTNITYKRAAPIVKAAEKAGLTQFGTYFYEVFRSQVGNVRQGIDEYKKALEAKTPEAKSAMLLQATKRLAGQGSLWAAAAYVSNALGSATFGDDDDEADKLRKLLPEYLRDQDFVQVGKDANGMPVLFNLSRVDPIGPATDIMRMMMSTEVTPEELAKKFTDLYVAPRLGGQLIRALGATFADTKVTRTPSTQQWFPTAYGEVLGAADTIPGVDDNTTRGWTNVAEMFFLPGATNALRDTNAKITDNEANAAFFGAMSFAGLTLAKLDPSKSAQFATMGYTDTLKNARTATAELFRDRPNVSQTEALAKISELANEEHKAYKKLRDVYLGMQAAGLTPAEATAILKEERLPVETIRAISNDTYTSQVVNKKSIDAFAAREMKGKTQAEKREIQQKWKDVWDVLSQVDKQVKEKK